MSLQVKNSLQTKWSADVYQTLLISGAGTGHHADPMAELHAHYELASDYVPESGEHDGRTQSDQPEILGIESASEPEPHDPGNREHQRQEPGKILCRT